MHEMKKEMKEMESFNVRKLSDGKFILSCGMEEYGYDTVDEVLSALRDDLGGEQEDDSESKHRKKKVKKIMGDEDEDY